MLLPDVNILLGAFAAPGSAQAPIRPWIEERLVGPEPFGVCDVVMSAVVRISTNRRAYPTPATPDQALAFCAAIRSAPAVMLVQPGRRQWDIFVGLVSSLRLRANDITDAYLAALALENDATFVTRDRGFARFPGLRLLDPLAA